MALTTLPTAAFATGSVGTSQLADGAVTTEKLVADVNFRNLIINGDMSIAQRGTSSSSVSGSGYYTVDRYRYGAGSGIVNTFSQSTDVPSGQGFKYSHKQEATTGDASLGADEYNIFQQRLEGYMFQSAKFGTSNAESLTLSFWIKASVTGTYVCELHNIDADVSQSQSYTVSSADTWEKKTITFSADTSNAINIDNGRGLDLNWWLGAGTTFSSGTLQTTWGTQVAANRAVGCTNAFASNNDTVFLTGVQLEVGTSASDFEFLPRDVNLQRCQRYYRRFKSTGQTEDDFATIYGNAANGDHVMVGVPLSPTMRSVPSVSIDNPLTIDDHFRSGRTQSSANCVINGNGKGTYIVLKCGNFSSMSTGNTIQFSHNTTTVTIQFSSEL